MRGKKPVRISDRVQVVYDETRWRLLSKLREKSVRIMKALEREGLPSIVHGSVARGDVTRESDIDIFIPVRVPPYRVELALYRAGFSIYFKEISQATPRHAIKGHIYLDELTIITFPLTDLTPLEREFYKFGGELTLEELLKGKRVPGVDKRLMLIEPKPYGHDEISVIGRESEVARILGVSIGIIKERVFILTKRDEKGRTGVYIKRALAPDEPFESALRRLAIDYPIIRRRLKGLTWL